MPSREINNLGQYWHSGPLRDEGCPALVYGPAESISWHELENCSNQLAARLLEENCQKGDVIAIGHEKTPWAYAAMLACLKLGMPYVVLDSAQPGERLRRILATARPKLLFYDEPAYEANLAGLGVKSILLEKGLFKAGYDFYPDLGKVDGETIAYIMFTSGSTGNPKGVAVPHENLLRFSKWSKARFGFGPQGILAQVSPMYFDNSVLDFYGGFLNGMRMAPISRKLLNAPYELVGHVAACDCDFWFSVPSLLIYLMTMKALSREKWSKIRRIVFGGEGYPKPELKKLYDLFACQATLTNVYGPTECTCICSAHDLAEADFADQQGLPTLGRLNGNFDWELANPDEKGIGELILMGPQVAAGYYNDPERTAQAFGICADLRRYQKRFYRTGDLVSQKDGKFCFHGRKDNQIKHLGYRIELEEIEAALMRLAGVSRAAVIYYRENTAFGKILAYAAYEGQADSKQLLHELGQHLPTYMLPSRLTLMAELPKNANGKVDKRALLTRCQP